METHFGPGRPAPAVSGDHDATGNVCGPMPPKTWRAAIRDWLRSVVAAFTPF